MKKICILLGLLLLASATSSFAQTGTRILMVVTGSGQISENKPTGLWLEEFAVPYLSFKDAGFEVTVASPKGGQAPVDPRSLKDGGKVLEWARAAVELEKTVALSGLSADSFDAIFLPGGHGTMFDFPGDPNLKRLLDQFALEDKVIAAVCHGPAGLVGARKPDGTPLVAGKTLTAFTDEEEVAVELDKAMPFLLESRLRELGARFIDGPLWQGHVEVDGKLVTGQNPASSAGAADAVIQLLTPPVPHSAVAPASLVEVARSERQWTGVAVAADGRMFVNYPRWSDQVPFSVAELHPDGSVAPFPDAGINRWDPSLNPADQLVCVQSVVVDRDGFLWILDPANPKFQGVIPGGPKLLKVDLASNRIIQTIRFAEPAIGPESYLNDVRIDTRRQVAYLTDSGAGALVVVDLATGGSRRVLAGHPSTRSEGVVLTIEGRPWRRTDGSAPQVHADGIALDPEGEYLYYQALTGRNLYRVNTRWLRDAQLGSEQLAGKVEHLGATGASDGLLFGPDRRIYISALEENAIKAYEPDGEMTTVVQGEALAWPDSFAEGPDGTIYFTTSQIHRGSKPTEPYKIFRIEMKK